MPFIELKCCKCGHEFEELTKIGSYPACPVCGGKTEQKYSGKIVVNSVSKNQCSGNCATCKGCK
jgi:putative FmdB family regulatory protein